MKKAKAHESKRFIMTILGTLLIAVATIFPMYIIIKASSQSIFEIAAAWTAWGICITTLGVINGNYVLRESKDPSFIGIGGLGINLPVPKKKVLNNHEDESDPESIPL